MNRSSRRYISDLPLKIYEAGFVSSILFCVLDWEVFGRPAGVHFGGVEKAGHREMHLDLLVSFVLPKPAMDTGARRRKRTVGLHLADLIVQFVALVIVLVRFLVGFSMEFEAKLSARLPRINHHRAFRHVILHFKPLTRN